MRYQLLRSRCGFGVLAFGAYAVVISGSLVAPTAVAQPAGEVNAPASTSVPPTLTPPPGSTPAGVPGLDGVPAADGAPQPEPVDPVTALIFLARTKVDAGAFDDAVTAATAALEADAERIEALVVRGMALNGQGNYEQAIADFDAVTARAGVDADLVKARGEAYTHRSRSLYELGRYLPAIDSAYFAILEDFDQVDAHLNRARAYLARKEYDKAMTSYDRALATAAKMGVKMPEGAGGRWGGRANAAPSMAAMPSMPASAPSYDATTTTGGSGTEQARPVGDRKAAEAYSGRGFARGGKGDFAGVVADQDLAIKLDPRLAIAYQRRGAAKALLGDTESALGDLKQALEIDPRLPEALCDRSTLRRLQGDLTMAYADAEAAVKAAPRMARAHVQRGLVLMAEGDGEAARRSFDAAVELEPDNLDALVGRGQALLAAKDYAAADADFTKVVELDTAQSYLPAYLGLVDARRQLGRKEGVSAALAVVRDIRAREKVASTGKPARVWRPQDRDTVAKANEPRYASDEERAADRRPRFRVVSKPVDPAKRAAMLRSAETIDRLVEQSYRQHDVKPMPETTDAQFVRRVYLDIVGRIPTYRETVAFLRSGLADKRTKLIDDLLGSDDYAGHAFNYWADTLRYRDSLAQDVQGEPWRQWIKQSLAESKPWDAFVYEMLTAEGLVWDNPATGYLHRDPGMPLDNVNNTVRIFLGTRIGCAQCHDHPFDKWTQKQFYEMAAFVYGTQTRVGGGDKRFWKDNPSPRLHDEYALIEQEEEDRRQKSYELDRLIRINMNIVADQPGRVIKLPADYQYENAKPGQAIEPKTIFGPEITVREGDSPREVFAKWLTSRDNPRFAKTIANRLWRQAFGVGQIEPIDDMTDDTVAENPPLMDHLEAEMKRLDFDMKEYLRILFNTKAYQRQASTVEPQPGYAYHFPGPVLRRMTAEQVWDSFLTLAVADWDYRELSAKPWTEAVAVNLEEVSAERMMESLQRMGSHSREAYEEQRPYKYQGLLLARASELPSPVPANHFLRIFGQSDRELISASSTAGSVPQVLFMFNGPVSHMLLEKDSTIYKNIVKQSSVTDGIKAVFLTILNRDPTPIELARAMKEVRDDGPVGYGNVVWSLVNTREFMFIQ
jgi:tetratricopeptide (TPR) repeat protein